MAGKNIFHQNPLLRLVVPLIAGVVIGWVCDVSALHALALSVIAVVALLLGLVRSAPKWLFGAGAMLFMLSAGVYVECMQSAGKEPEWLGGRHEYKAQLLEVPSVRGTSVKVLADLTLQGDSVQGRRQGDVCLYFPRTVDTELLAAGDSLAIETYIAPPENNGNPEEFNIERYYYVKGVTGTAFVPDGKWKKLPSGNKKLRTRSLELRAKIISLYEELGFDGEGLALLSALTLGEKRDFPQELKENYSAAGASHILALSGLHLGVLYMLLAFMLPLRGRKFIYRLLRELSIVLLLWGFVFVTGLSPSVVRSAILFTLISLGRMSGQEVSPLSSLSFAAVVMLLFSPHLLFDVSFQLSFAAVLSIILLVPHLHRLTGVHTHGVVYGYVANLLILSFVAQLGTLPFVWYHFGVFPIYFMLTNLFVVPLAFVLMMLAVAVWVLSPVAVLSKMVVFPLSWAVALMNGCVRWVAALPGASFSLPPLGVWGGVCVAFLIALIAFSLVQRRKRLFAMSAVATVGFVVLCLFVSRPSEKGNYMLIYNNYKNPLLHLVFDDGKNYLVSTVPQLDAEYEYVSEPYIKSRSLPVPEWVNWQYSDSLVQCDEGCFVFDGLTVKVLDNTLWRDAECATPVDILVIGRGFLGRIKDLVEVYPASCVVVDASLYKRSRERIKREYANLGVDVVDVSQTGAMKVVATDEGFDLIPMSDK